MRLVADSICKIEVSLVDTADRSPSLTGFTSGNLLIKGGTDPIVDADSTSLSGNVLAFSGVEIPPDVEGHYSGQVTLTIGTDQIRSYPFLVEILPAL